MNNRRKDKVKNDSPDNRSSKKIIGQESVLSSFHESTRLEEAQPVFTSLITKMQNKEAVLHSKLDKPFSTVDGKLKTFSLDIPPMPDVADTWFVIHVLTPSEGYPMVRTTFNVSLTDGTTVETIAEKIFASNKMRSIHAEYDDEDAIAKCKTRSFMKFQVRLFQGSHGTVSIEVQRRSGCSLAFKEEYQALLQVFKGDSIPQVPTRNKLDLAQLKCLESDLILLPEGAIEESLELSLKHLSSDMYDTRMLALEDLIASTDSESGDIALKACQLILYKYTDIFTIILDLICKVDDLEYYDDDSFERFHCLALTLLRNISIKCSREENFILITSEDKLLQSLLRDIRMAAKFPWNACLATQCLSKICVNSNQAVARVAELADSVQEALEKAQEVGEKCYQCLEDEAKHALEIMKTL